MKKTFVLIIVIVSMLFICINNVDALEERELKIGNISYYLGDTIKNSEGQEISLPAKLSWNNETETLTLNNYIGSNIYSVTSGYDLNLYLIGTNIINSFYTPNIGGIRTENGNINIDGTNDSVLKMNLEFEPPLEANFRGIFASNYSSKGNITINNGNIDIKAKIDHEYTDAIYGKNVIVNNNANLKIDVKNISKKITRSTGIFASLSVNGTGDVSVISNDVAISGDLTLNSKGNTLIAGNKKTLTGSLLYSSIEGATTSDDYSFYGIETDNVFYAKYNTVSGGDNITINELPLPVPVGAEKPEKLIETDEYFGSVSWNEEMDYFDKNTIYTAQITIVPKIGYTLDGITNDFFNIEGATSVGYSNGVVTATFPSSGEGIKTTINSVIELAIPVPIGGEDVNSSFETNEYTAKISYKITGTDNVVSTFLYNTKHTAIITIEPKEGYTTVGIAENSYTIQGLDSSDATITNDKNSNVITVSYTNPTVEGTNVTIEVTDYKIKEDDSSSYANLPEGITYDPENNRLVLENYYGKNIYNKNKYMPLNIYLKGKNELLGKMYYSENNALYTKTAPINIDGDENSRLNINIKDSITSRGMFISDKSLSDNVTINNAKVYIKINQSGGDATAGIYCNKTILTGKARLNIDINSSAGVWIDGLSSNLEMQSTDAINIKVVGQDDETTLEALDGVATYNEDNYNLYNYGGEFSLEYKTTSNITLLPMSHGTAAVKSTARTGESITIDSIEPDDNYSFQKVVIYDENDNDITNEVKYYAPFNSFIMPPYPVKVKVLFIQSSFSYDITSLPTENGEFYVNSKAFSGNTVTIDIHPLDHYELKQVKILRAIDDVDVTSTVSYDADENNFVMPSYAVKVSVVFKGVSSKITKKDTSNGTFIVPTSGEYASTITISDTPATDYEIDAINIYKKSTEANVNEDVLLDVTNKTFVMPYYDVIVEVKFKKIIYNITTAPTLTIKSNGYSSLLLSWDEITGADGYKIYRATSSKGTYKYFTTVTDNKYINTGLTSGRTYYYKIRGYNSDSTGPLSKYTSGKAIPDKTTLSLVSVSYSSVKLSWTKVTGATGYRIYRATSEDGTYSHIKTITSGSTLSYTDTGRITNKTYYYKVKAIRSKSGYTGYSNYSNVISGKPFLKTPVVTGYNDYYRYAKISWNKISGAQRYNVYRSDTEDGDIKYIGYTTSTAYCDKTAKEGETYYYQIRAYRKASGSVKYSEYSEKVSATRIEDTINYSLTSGYSYITLTIDEVPNATKYYIYRATSKTGTYSLITTKTNEDVNEGKLVYTNTKRTYNKTYYYKVRVYRKTYSDYSAIGYIKTKLESPTLSVEVGTSPKEISMTISKVYGATGYEIYSSETEDGTYTLLKRTSSLTYSYELTEEKYQANKTYYYKVIPYRMVNKKRIYGYESTIKNITLE